MTAGTTEVTTGSKLVKTGSKGQKTGNMAQKAGSSVVLAKISLRGEKAAGRGKKFPKYPRPLLVKTIQTRIQKLIRGYRSTTPSQEGTTQQAITMMMTEETTNK